MSTVTPNINLTKPASIEQFSLALLNANSDKIDAKHIGIATATTTYKGGGFDGTNSQFTRIGTLTDPKLGIVTALIIITLTTGTSITFPAGTSDTGVNFSSDLFPSNVRPLQTVGWVTGALLTGGGTNIPLSAKVSATGNMELKAEANTQQAISSSPAGCQIRWQVTYNWNGVV